MRKFNVKGMSCAACSARVEKAVSSLPGIESCSVNLLTNSMMVDGKISTEAIIKAVENAGYTASLHNKSSSYEENTNPVSLIKRRLFVSLGLLVFLMYISMGHNMLRLPLPHFLTENPIIIAIIQFVLAAGVLVINRQFFINGFKGVIHRSANMDTLISIGSLAGFLYSTAVIFQMIKAENVDFAKEALHDLYFESSAMILVLITLGKLLESRAKGKTTNALKSLMSLSPKTATIIKDDKEVCVRIEDVKIGDIFTVRPGESVAVDGIVTEGFSAVDESMLNGESIPVEKQVNSPVYAGCINRSGFLKCKATKVGEDTAISQIIKIVNDAAASKAPIAKVADKVSGIFVPIVIAIAVITTVIWLLCGQTIGYALARGISVLVISCPCALGLATPVAIMVASGKSAKLGILFKNAVSLEQTAKISAIALDKTGTVTEGVPSVTDIAPHNISEQELLSFAYSLEQKSEHPISKAIIRHSKENQISPFDVTDFEITVGNGLCAKLDGKLLKGGSIGFIGDIVPQKFKDLAKEYSENGKTPLFFSLDNTFCGIIAVADKIKSDSSNAIMELQNMGISVIMISGDNITTANTIAKSLNIDKVYAEVLPDGKRDIIQSLKNNGVVAMVGDGINDAPALTTADIGIAIGAGTDIAIDSADIVLMNNRLSDVCSAIRISKATLRIIHQNLFWAFLYNCIGIPLAAGAFISLFGWQMNPMFGAAAMSLSSFCVISNALRLNRLNLSKTRNKKVKENQNMTTTLVIEGMMCPHCEARVKSTLEAVDGVASAKVSHKDGTAVITSSSPLDEILKAAVENQGYKVLEIKK